MKRSIPLSILILFLVHFSHAQVSMKRIENHSIIYQKHAKLKPNKKIIIPRVNVASLIEEDKNDDSGLPPRFGKALDVNIALTDGT